MMTKIVKWISALIVLLMPAIAVPQSGSATQYPTQVLQTEAPTLIFWNGHVITMDDDMPVAQAIAIKDDCIVAVGGNQEILNWQGPDTLVVDLCGRTVLPGFIDAHSHWINDVNYAGLGVPYQTGHRWLPPWCLGDRTGGRVTVQYSIQEALKGGWTSISNMFTWETCLNEIRALDEAGELGIRVDAYLPLNYQFQRFGNWYQKYPQGLEISSKVRIGGVKIFVDDADYGQSVYFDQGELTALVLEAHQKGYQIAVHAMDAGIDMTFNAFQVLGKESNAEFRHRVEHLVVLDDDQLDQLKNLGLIASFQLTWFTSGTWDIWDAKKYIGLDRVELVGRWYDILAAGIPSIGSTDYPWFYGADGSAMTTVYKAVTRIGKPGVPPPQWVLDQRITVEQALQLITIDAAYGTFQENVKGSIAVGKFADLVVLSENPLAADPERLMDVFVLMTMVGGHVEYCAPGHEYLYGTVVEALDAFNCETFSDTSLPTLTEEWVATTEAISSSKEGT